jgi:hypothetical protein
VVVMAAAAAASTAGVGEDAVDCYCSMDAAGVAGEEAVFERRLGLRHPMGRNVQSVFHRFHAVAAVGAAAAAAARFPT